MTDDPIPFYELRRIANRVWWRQQRIHDYMDEIDLILADLNPTELQAVDTLVRGDTGDDE